MTQTTSGPPQSEDEFYDFEDDNQVISHSRLRVDEARARFHPSSVDASGADFSDRVDGKRQSYKTSSRRQRILQNGIVEYGELSEDDEDETLERRMARLRREIEEVREEHAKRQVAATTNDEGRSSNQSTDIDSMSQVLDDIARTSNPSASTETGRPVRGSNVVSQGPAPGSGLSEDPDQTTLDHQTHALLKTADFDRRLAALEKGLGIGPSLLGISDGSGPPKAVLPTLDAVEKQVMVLSQSSTSNLDTISRRVRNLASEQDRLNESREKARTLREELGKNTGGTPPADDSEQEAKINALYGILPTIESLTPLLPPLLDRLRSLKVIHSGAAAASQTLDKIEQQQTSMTAELRQWREGLEKMESAMRTGDETMQGNVKVMEGWVKDLEQRVSKLG